MRERKQEAPHEQRAKKYVLLPFSAADLPPSTGGGVELLHYNKRVRRRKYIHSDQMPENKHIFELQKAKSKKRGAA
jgi:hypothetical protein